uniref:Uncharacterized protein n=1 Tax=Romanomermis culicivorax TaxID=13658 RepID=A0A915L6I2_ROMCU
MCQARPQDVLTSARSASSQDSFLQVAMMSTMDAPQPLALLMNSAASSGLSRTLASHTAHDAGAPAEQAPSHATSSNPSNRNCQQLNFATDNNLQRQPCDQQAISSITDACGLELENFRCQAKDVLDQMTIATMRLMNNVPTTQTIDQIRVADSTIVQAHGPVVINMESKFGNYPLKCVVLDDDTQDRLTIGTDFLTHPEINVVLSFKDEYIEIGNKRL